MVSTLVWLDAISVPMLMELQMAVCLEKPACRMAFWWNPIPVKLNYIVMATTLAIRTRLIATNGVSAMASPLERVNLLQLLLVSSLLSAHASEGKLVTSAPHRPPLGNSRAGHG